MTGAASAVGDTVAGDTVAGDTVAGDTVAGDTVAGETVAEEVEVLRALAHPVRWGMLLRLAAEPGICACDFTEFFAVSQPTISAHLKVLREAGLVVTRRIGTTICYSIAPGQLGRLGARLTAMEATAPPAV